MQSSGETSGQIARSPSSAGPLRPVRHDYCALQPLTTAIRLGDGFWGRRQALNRSVSIPHGIKMLEDSGALWNLRLAAGRAHGPYRMPLYRDANVYVVLEAVAWDRRHGNLEAHEEFFEATSELLAAAQAPDGYLNSYVQVCNPEGRFADPEHGHELFCAGHLIQAAIADTRTGGRGSLMNVARGFADYLCDFLPMRPELVEGHPEVETALVELFRLSGERKYLNLATALLDRRGHRNLQAGHFGAEYFQDDVPVRSCSEVRGHAVRALYLAAGATDCYMETGDPLLFDSMVTQWQDMVSAKAYLTGGLGSRHEGEAFGDPFELPADRAYCETCASIAAVMWSWRMLLVTGEARYAAFAERVLYNAFAAALGADGGSYFYVNPLKSRGDHHREPWYETACCPPNAMRLLASIEDYVATATSTGVQFQQFVPGDVETTIGSEPFALSMMTECPWDGTLSVRVRECPTTEAEIAVRLPEWSGHPVLQLNGEDHGVVVNASGYLTVNRRWEAGDELAIVFPLKPRVIGAHPAVDAVRSSLAIERGPLVYCFEGIDLSGASMTDLRLPGSGAVDGEGTLVIGGERLVTLSVNALTVAPPGPRSWPYQEQLTTAVTLEEPVPLRTTAIPYFAWDRRGACNMRVWVPQSEPPPAPVPPQGPGALLDTRGPE